MVGGALARASALHVGLGVGGTTIASGSRVRTSHSWTSRLLTSSFSLGVSSLFCWNVVYYESLKRELKTKKIYGYRCDERIIKLT